MAQNEESFSPASRRATGGGSLLRGSLLCQPKLQLGGLKSAAADDDEAGHHTLKADTPTVGAKPTFLPLGGQNRDATGASTPTQSSTPRSSPPPPARAAAAFVFGENLTDRAENFSDTPDPPAVEEPPESAADAEAAGPKRKAAGEETTLSESAAKYCQELASKQKTYDEVVPVTGEENERNVHQIQAKLHVFDKATGAWHERGRGLCRLNDHRETGQSRLIMRTGGSLRVILNTILFPEMSVERPTEKTIRLTGLDQGVPKIFLLSATIKDAQNLLDAILNRKPELATTTSTPTTAPEPDDANGDELPAKRPKLSETEPPPSP